MTLPRFSNLAHAPTDSPVAIGGQMTAAWLENAYRQGVFPWYNEGEPIQWWSPDPRFVLFPQNLIVSKSLARELKNSRWHVSFDQQFRKIMKACAITLRPGQEGTWITAAMLNAYYDLHQAGIAHSIEVFHDGKLAGGLYGVSLGKVFFGESMFSHHRNASKVGLVRLVELLQHWEFDLIDCQVPTEHLASLGAEIISRTTFLQQLAQSLHSPTRRGIWKMPNISPI